MTTGHNTAVTERTPETPSSARLTAGFPPPPVVAVERGRAAVRPACVARAATIAHARRQPRIEIERARRCEREHPSDDRRDRQPDRVQHVIDDRNLVPDEVRHADDAHDPQHDRIAERVPRRRQVDQIGRNGRAADAQDRDIGIEPGCRREPEGGEVSGDPFHSEDVIRSTPVAIGVRLHPQPSGYPR